MFHRCLFSFAFGVRNKIYQYQSCSLLLTVVLEKTKIKLNTGINNGINLFIKMKCK